jgi:hypothetical protein
VPESRLFLAALEQSVAMWKTDRLVNAYFCGDRAYEHWLDWLRGIDEGEIDSPAEGMQGNGWCYDVLVHSRRIASRWLEEQAEEVEKEARTHLLHAAENYALVANALMRELECSWELALPPESYGDWTSQMRDEQIQRLEIAREHGRSAIGAIERVLDLLP